MHRHKWVEDQMDSRDDDNGWWYDCKCGARRHNWFDQDESGSDVYEAGY